MNRIAGSLCISIDLELAWGVWDHVTDRDLRLAADLERPIVRRLLELAERYSIAMTWATVGSLFDSTADLSQRPGPREAWFAPELVEQIQKAAVGHDIGSHSWSHIYFGSLPRDAARAELERDVELRRRWGLPMTSWVFPRNDIGHVDLLVDAGVRVYRTLDQGLLGVVRRRVPRAYPLANLAEKILPVVPPLVHAEPPRAGLVALPSSTLLMGRNGLRRLVRPEIMRWRYAHALDAAAAGGGVFHLWFHPSNFYHDGEAQFDVLEQTFAQAARLRESGRLDIRTMADFAAHVAQGIT